MFTWGWLIIFCEIILLSLLFIRGLALNKELLIEFGIGSDICVFNSSEILLFIENCKGLLFKEFDKEFFI